MSAQHLPPFSQAFSAKSISQIDEHANSLPPIHSRSPVPPPRPHDACSPESTFARTSDVRTAMGKKRSRAPENDDEQNSHGVRVKEEDDKEPSADVNMDTSEDQPGRSVVPPPVTQAGVKKRRMTLSGAAPLNTDIRLSTAEKNSNASTPVSPVVMGFTLARDDPAALETVRSTIAVKEQQRALIEQRRGSLQYPIPSQNSPRINHTDERHPGGVSKALRKSPNGSHGRGRSPPPPAAIAHLPHAAHPHPPPPPSSHDRMASTLPPPPISFAHRRANLLGPTSRRKKPADIVISPRSAQNQDELQPVIQSAPPVPFGGGAGMMLPRLPPILGSDSGTAQPLSQRGRITVVPPTPGRLNRLTVHTVPAQPGRSPPTSSVPIASSLVPPTPSFLKPSFGSTSTANAPADREKQAFLAQFEQFYDTLNDSKQLKTWLNDQLVKSSQMTERLENTIRKYEDVIDGMRREISGLRGRVDELEDRVRHAEGGGHLPSIPSYHSSSRRNSLEHTPALGPKKLGIRHSPRPAPPVPQEYTFPSRRDPSSPQRDPIERQASDLSPGPYASRRLSVSNVRMDTGNTPRPHPSSGSGPGPGAGPGPMVEHGRNAYHHMSRDREHPHSHLPPPPLSSAPSKEGNNSRPPLKRQQSNPGSALRNRFDRDDEHVHQQQQQRKVGVGAGSSASMATD